MRIHVALAIALSGLLSGCALINAYPTSEDFEHGVGSDNSKDTEDSPPQGTAKTGLDKPLTCPAVADGIMKARCERHTYERYLRQSGYANSMDGAGLLGLAALVGYKATESPRHRKNISALTFGGVAWYGAYTYLDAKPRDAIYIAGITALNCGIEQARPWLRTEPEGFEKGYIDPLTTKIAELRRVITNAQNYNAVSAEDQNGCPSRRQNLTDQTNNANKLADLEKQLAADEKVLADAVTYYSAMQSNRVAADDNLKMAVDAIHAEVLLQLAAQQPDPSKLANQLSVFVPKPASSASKASSNTPAPEGAAATPAPAMGIAGAQNAVANLAREVENSTCGLQSKNLAVTRALDEATDDANDADLNGLMKGVNVILADKAEDPAVSGNYRQCAALAAAGGGPLQLVQASGDPPSLKLPDGTLQIGFFGGVPPYSATVLVQPKKGNISATVQTASSGQGYNVDITVDGVTSDADNTSATYSLLLSDTTGSSKVVHFKIAASTTTPKGLGAAGHKVVGAKK